MFKLSYPIFRVNIVFLLAILLLAGAISLILPVSESVASTVVDEFPICTAPGNQYVPRISGNCAVWQDYRNGNWDIYLKDLSTGIERQITNSADDETLPAIYGDEIVYHRGPSIYLYNLSTNTGSVICTSANSSTGPCISGNYVVWQDYRNGNYDIYGYDLLTGIEFPICTDTAVQEYPDISGNYVVWVDSRNGLGSHDIYGYDLSTKTELPICTNSQTQIEPSISGNYVAWRDHRNGTADIYGYDLSTKTEFAVCTNDSFKNKPRISGNYVTWADNRNSSSSDDIYGYDLSTKTEFAICTQSGSTQGNGDISGNYVVWQDYRNGNSDIYGAKITELSDTFTPTYPNPNPDPSSASPYAGVSDFTKSYLVQMHDHYMPSDYYLPSDLKSEILNSISNPQRVIDMYKQKGYDKVFVTEHDKLTFDENGMASEEASSETDRSRHIGATGIDNSANNRPYNPDNKYHNVKYRLDALRNYRAYVVANHPNQSKSGFDYHWTPDDLSCLQKNEAVEVYNTSVDKTLGKLCSVPGFGTLQTSNMPAYGMLQWDYLLSSGKHIWGVAGDDYTWLENVGFDGGAIRVFADDSSTASILSAIRQGRFYATQGSDGPTIDGILVEPDGFVTIYTSSSADFKFIGNAGRTLKEVKGLSLTECSYQIQGDEKYVRVEITRQSDHKKAWSNPIFVGKKGSITSPYAGIATGGISAYGWLGALSIPEATPTVISFEESTLTIPAQPTTGTINGELVLPDQMPENTPHWGYFSDLYKFTPANTTFTPEATLTISYAGEDYSLVGEDYLAVFRYDEASGNWVALPSMVDKENKQVSTKVSSLGIFALSANFTEDTVSPSVIISSPLASAALSGTATIEASATDDHGIYRTSIYLDDILLGEDTSAADDISLPVDFSKYANGAHNLDIIAEDACGNTGHTTVPVNITSAVEPIGVTISAPISLQDVESSVVVAGSIAGAINRVSIAVDGASLDDITDLSAGDFNYKLNSSKLAAGEHTITVAAYDEALNSGSNSVRINVVPDTQAPDTAILEHPQSETYQPDARFSFTGTDNRTNNDDLFYLCKLEGLDATYTIESTNTVAYNNLPAGYYTFRVKAIDWAGNIDPSEATFSFKVRHASTTTMTVSPAEPNGLNGWYTTKPTITLSPNETATIHYFWDNGLEATQGATTSAPITFTAPEGIHILSYYAVDLAENTEATRSITFMVDTTISTPVLDSIDTVTATSLNAVLVRGTADESSTVYITASDGINESTATVVSSGAFSTTMNLSNLRDGTITFTAHAKDEAGNISPISLVVQAIKDTSLPAITNTDPVNNATNVSKAKTIAVTFGENIQADSAFNNIVIRDASNGQVAISKNISEKTLTLDPVNDLSNETTYTVAIPAGAVRDMVGNISSGYTLSFKTEVAPNGGSQEAYQFVDMWPKLPQPWYFSPRGIVMDSLGNIYVADAQNNCIQKLSPDGTFIAKWGSSGSGDGQFYSPSGVAIDSQGNIYVADSENGRIQKFSPNGAFITRWTHDDQIGMSPSSIAIDSQGNVYVTDHNNRCIQKFTADGIFITKWGSSGRGDSQFIWPKAIATDSQGYVYVADAENGRIQKFTSDGTFVTKWGTQGIGDGQFYYPDGIGVDPQGNIYVADGGNHRIQKFTSNGTFIAKWGSFGSGDGKFNWPASIIIDSQGNMYVADSNNIQKFTPDGTFITKWGSSGSDNRQLSWPLDIATDLEGNVYVADTNNHRIQKFTCDGTFIANWQVLSIDDGQLYRLFKIAVDTQSNIYVADNYKNQIKKFTPDGNLVTSWGSYGSGDGQFQELWGIATDSQGNVYIADRDNNRIQKFTPDGTFITKWGSSGSGDGQFVDPTDISVDLQGNVYVTDSSNQRIQKFTSNGTFIKKWGSFGSGDGQFDWPCYITVDSQGYIYVADANNNRIQKFTPDGTFVTKWGTKGSDEGQFNGIGGVATGLQGNIYIADSGNNCIQKFAPVNSNTNPTVPVIDSVTNPINSANVSGVEVKGTADLGLTIYITAKDVDGKEATATAVSSGTFNASINLSNLKDGIITFTAYAKDGAGNTGSLSNALQAIKDTVSPTVSVTIPTNNATNISRDTTITLTFSENIDTDSAFNNITVKDAGNNTIAIGKSISNNLLLIDPINNLAYDTVYTVTIPAGAVRDITGNSLANQYTLTFKTQAAPDATAPTTMLSTSPAIADGKNGWFKSAATITLTRSEFGTTYYKWNAAPSFSVYTSSLAALSGTNTLYYYSVDTAGNTETVNSQIIKVDTSTPTSFSLTSPTDNAWTANQHPTLSWSASTDTVSGLAKYTIKIDGAVDQQVGSAVTSTQTAATLTPGPHTWFVVVEDMAGNQTTATARTINIDTTNPTAMITSPTNNTTEAGAFSIVGTASDTNFASYKLEYGAGASPSSWTTITSSSAAVTNNALGTLNTSLLANGDYTIRLTATDKAGNTATTSILIHTDNTAPTTMLSTSPLTPDGANGWFKSETTITLTPSEPGTTYYQWDTTSGAWVTYSGSITALEGNHTLYFYSKDNLGNKETMQNQGIKLDKTQPSTPKPSITALSSSDIKISWPASTDTHSGIDHYLINITDGNITETTATTGLSYTFKVTPDITYTTSVIAYDVAGNASKSDDRVAIVKSGSVASTPAGKDVAVALKPSSDSKPLTLSFTSVNIAGDTSVTTSSANDKGEPTGFNVQGVYYDISTTASVEGTITITIPYDDKDLTLEQENALKLYHFEGGQWKDVTKLVDTTNNFITGETLSLSPFVVCKPKPAQQPLSGGGSSGSSNTEKDKKLPQPPSGLNYKANVKVITLAWQKSTDDNVAGYNVYRKDSNGTTFNKLNSSLITNTEFEDASAKTDIVYVYCITAVDKAGNESLKSSEVEAALSIIKAETIFSDVPVNAWYKDYISKLILNGILGGYEDGTFRPNKAATRAEFAKILCYAMDWQLIKPAKPSFKDVPKSSWAYEFVETAKAHGAINGYSNGSFNPDKSITRAEIAKIIAETLKLAPGTSNLKDISKHWAKNYIDACAKAGILGGYNDNTFRPNNTTTRAEVAKIISAVLKD